jgi:Putative phage abortive infection protein
VSEGITRPFIRYNNPFIWGWLLTAITVSVAYYFLSASVCSSIPSGTGWCTTKWQKLLAAPPNELGDTLAGFSGSLAFVWLFVAVWLQSQELQDQRAQISLQTEEFKESNSNLKRQRFETTFFELLRSYNEIVRSIDLINPENQQTTTGRDCFRIFYSRLNRLYREKVSKGHEEAVCLEMAYRNFWRDHQLELGNYFRFLYNSLRFISESGYKEDYHGRLLRSQLSEQELLILFYNCVSPQGKNFQKYASEFKIFDNLPTVRLLSTSHSTLLDKSCFGDNPMLTFKDMKHSINVAKKDRVK